MRFAALQSLVGKLPPTKASVSTYKKRDLGNIKEKSKRRGKDETSINLRRVYHSGLKSYYTGGWMDWILLRKLDLQF